MNTLKDDLINVRALLKRRGWTQGGLSDDGVALCIEGAVMVVTGADLPTTLLSNTGRYSHSRRGRACIKALYQQIPFPAGSLGFLTRHGWISPTPDAIWPWNDYVATKETVFGLLDAAIAACDEDRSPSWEDLNAQLRAIADISVIAEISAEMVALAATGVSEAVTDGTVVLTT